MAEKDEASAVLAQLANAHRRSALRLSALRHQAQSGNTLDLEFVTAVADEASDRAALIAWNAPDASLLTEKLLHLLVHVMEADTGFDDLSLSRITAEVARFIRQSSKPLGADSATGCSSAMCAQPEVRQT